MPDYAKIIAKNVERAFDKQLAPGNLTEAVTFKLWESEGTYDVATDTTEAVFTDVEDVEVIVSKPTEDDQKDLDVIATDAKLVFPASKLPKKPEADTDKVIRANGEEWDVRKVGEVPGGSIYLVFIYRA